MGILYRRLSTWPYDGLTVEVVCLYGCGRMAHAKSTRGRGGLFRIARRERYRFSPFALQPSEHLVESDFLGISGRHRRLLTPAPAATLKLNILRWLRLLVAASGASTGAAMGAGLEGADLP